MAPTDFSFVTPEGWKALEPQFERAKKKIEQKVEKKEMTPDQGRRLTDLMQEKYDHWSSGQGGKKKEKQTVLQDSKKTATAMQREARIGRTQLIDILNAIADGTIQNPAVFQDVLRLNHIEEPEFFDLLAQDAARYPQLYPKQYVGFLSEHFSDWGYEAEIAKVREQARGAVGPQQPKSYDRPAPAAPAAPSGKLEGPGSPAAPAAQPPAKTTPAVPGEPVTVDDIAPQRPTPKQEAVEPRPWPANVRVPPPSADGQGSRWYIQYRDQGLEKASLVNDLNLADVQKFAIGLRDQGIEVHRFKKLQSAEFPGAKGPQAPAAPAQAPAAKAPAAPQAQAPAAQAPAAEKTGPIEEPDAKDPNTYRWYVRFQVGNKKPTALSPDWTGAEALMARKRYEQMGIKILEMTKMNISAKASLVVTDADIRLAEGEGAEERFRNGTPIIFTEDVNLEFDALEARGQIKKNMTGKIKKVEDNDYLIDIAGQLYRVPRLVAEHVMDVFAANVIGKEPEGQEDGQVPGQEQGVKPEDVSMAPAKPAGQVPGQNAAPAGPVPPGGAPKIPQGMAAAEGRIVVSEDDLDRIVVADHEVEAMPRGNKDVADDFARGATKGKGSNLFIEGDTIYSYGRHFPVATWVDGVVYLTTKKYSVSTAQHVSKVRNALSNAGVQYVLSDEVVDGKVAVPSPEEVARHEQEAAAQLQQDEARQQRRELKRQKEMGKTRIPSPEQAQDVAEVEQADEFGRPLRQRVDTRRAPQAPEDLDMLPSLSPEQMQARIQDVEDQLLRETNPQRQEILRQKMERMKMGARWDAMNRVAGTDNPMGGDKANFDDLHLLIKEQDKSHLKLERNDLKPEHKLPQPTAATKVQGFADLLMLIEQGGPGIPSEIGLRLYSGNGSVSRISA